jgi:phosphoribosylformylglycinamidine synthase PurS subunit
MKAKVYVTLKQGVLDPQGQAVARALGRLGFSEVKDARIGKYIEVQLADDVRDVEAHLKQMCEKLLANTVIEEYRYEIVK